MLALRLIGGNVDDARFGNHKATVDKKSLFWWGLLR